MFFVLRLPVVASCFSLKSLNSGLGKGFAATLDIRQIARRFTVCLNLQLLNDRGFCEDWRHRRSA